MVNIFFSKLLLSRRVSMQHPDEMWTGNHEVACKRILEEVGILPRDAWRPLTSQANQRRGLQWDFFWLGDIRHLSSGYSKEVVWNLVVAPRGDVHQPVESSLLK